MTIPSCKSRSSRIRRRSSKSDDVTARARILRCNLLIHAFDPSAADSLFVAEEESVHRDYLRADRRK